ncbi:MAG: hypothetical protein PGN13_15545 [Patulibacter minatonensis]
MFLALLADGSRLELDDESSRLAQARLQACVRSPVETLRSRVAAAERTVRRLYRQRNLVLHGGRVDGVALSRSLTTAAPLVGAGIDRLAHAHFTAGTEPLDLAARAIHAVAVVGTARAKPLGELLE